jgi:GTP-binding protein Era
VVGVEYDGCKVTRSGFVTLVGRPNVGKSSLVNAMCGRKVSIVSDKPQTTRRQVRGIVTRPEGQLVFVDTPGLHKPVTALGERVNTAALDSIVDVDVVCLVIDATQTVGSGDSWVASRLDVARSVVVLNKIDAVPRETVVEQLAKLSSLDAESYFPVSARTGEGVDALVDHLFGRLPEGPLYYPDDAISDVSESDWVAELVREELLGMMHDELPYSIATRVVDVEDGRIVCEILVERESQKGMVIGRGGAVLKRVGRRVRKQLPPGTALDLKVKVDKDWQRRPERIERLGY